MLVVGVLCIVAALPLNLILMLFKDCLHCRPSFPSPPLFHPHGFIHIKGGRMLEKKRACGWILRIAERLLRTSFYMLTFISDVDLVTHTSLMSFYFQHQVIGIFAGFGILLLLASPFLLLIAPCILCCKCNLCHCRDEEDNLPT